MDDDILIVGADGLIGSGLAEKASEKGMSWKGTSRRRNGKSGKFVFLDLANEKSVDDLSLAPRVAYLCAAATSLSQCNEDFLATCRINVEHTYRLAMNLARRGSALVFLSTNLVFDGETPRVTADAPTSPRTAYGRQKAEMENRLLNEFEKVAIVRLTKVVHPEFKLFKKWRIDLQAGLTISPFSNLVFSPIELSSVVVELLAFAETFRPGIYQLSGDRDLTYLEAAQLLAGVMGLDAKRIASKTCSEAGLSAAGPRHTTLEYRSPGLNGAAPSVKATLESLFQKIISAPS